MTTLVLNTETDSYFHPKMEEGPKNQKSIFWQVKYFQEVLDKKVFGFFYVMDNIIIYHIMNDIQCGNENTDDLHGDICELGAGEGKSVIPLSNYKQSDENLYVYEIVEKNQEKSQSNMEIYGTPENVHWRLQDTTTLKPEDIQFENPLRILHIDACHEYIAVLSDLHLFSKFMAKEGVIIVDDYNDVEYPGINAACLKFCIDQDEWVLFAIGQNKAYLCHKDFWEYYITQLSSLLYDDFVNKRFEFRLCLRHIFNNNVLICCSRDLKWTAEEVFAKLYSLPVIG